MTRDTNPRRRGGNKKRGKGPRGGPGRGPRDAEGKGKGDDGRKPRGPGARAIAARVVRGTLEGRGAARTLLDRAIEEASEKRHSLRVGLTTELVYGTIRNLGTLDMLLDACAKKGLRKVEDSVLAHLRIAAYQLVFLDNVPAAIAVNEAVSAVGVRSHVRGFVNGVLRKLGRLVTRRTPDDMPPLGVPSTRRLPGRVGGWIVLSDPLLPAAEQDPGGWLAAAASLPLTLATRWVETHGLDGALEIARAQNAPPPVFLRVNTLRGTREEVLALLEREGSPGREGGRPESVVLGGGLSAGGFNPLWAGLATVQDETAMAVAPLLDPKPGERVVDLCAAPGSKTTHLAQLMNDEGRIDALDIDAGRLAKVDEAAGRLGLKCIRTALVDPNDPRPEDGPADCVLADVPCSNTGVLRRRVEVRWRLSALRLPELLELQARLLDRAVDLVRPGGRVVYSTCSIEHAENGAQVEALLARRDDVRLESEQSRMPTRGGGDGGYTALLTRLG